MHTPQSATHAATLGRAALWAGLAIWTFSLLRTPLPDLAASFMHLIHLPFHEAGHILLMPFGSFMMSLGGSLLQVLVPVICAWAFLFQQEDPFAAAACVWWTGESLLDLSPYIDDARSLQLMLLGGPAAEVEGHDWEAILTVLDWLHLDHSLARLAWVLGAGLMIGALVWMAIISLSAPHGDSNASA
ncbi:MAG: hypothetical protein EXQ55_05335 [Acidobacteria bacterium]|nr:hypothetical protein [Acidobacteriota bacterium]